MKENFRLAGQIDRVKKLLENLPHGEPLTVYLQKFFNRNRNMGSRDRRMTRDWIYNTLRTGRNLFHVDFPVRLAVAVYLCIEKPDPITREVISHFLPFNDDQVLKSLQERLEIVFREIPEFSLENVFPFFSELTAAIDGPSYARSMLVQPQVWINVKAESTEEVLHELTLKNTQFVKAEGNRDAYMIPGREKLEDLETYKKGFFEVQDLNSQMTAGYFRPKPGDAWWDACCGSGGKSLLLAKVQPDVRIFASDVRPSIVQNLKHRCAKNGLSSIEAGVMDVEIERPVRNSFYDGIIADVPCSGSGTWARSPEWLVNFSAKSIDEKYVQRQRRIVENILPSLKSGAPLIYITCSVFAQENERNIEFFRDRLNLEVQESRYLEGFTIGADTLFVARLIKS